MGNEVSGEISKEDLIEIKKKQLLLEQENKKIKQKLKQQEELSMSKELSQTNPISSSRKELSEKNVSSSNNKDRKEKIKSSKELSQTVPNSSGHKENPKEIPKEKNKLPKNFVLPKQKQTIPVQLNSSTIQIDPFTIFSLEPDCSIEDIKKVYKQLVLKYHPDKSGYNSTDDYKVIQKAYAVLLSIKEEEGKITGMISQTIETKTDERKKLDTAIDNTVNHHFEPASGSQFDKKRFNDMFTKNKFIDNEQDDGYANWLKQAELEHTTPTISTYTKDGFNNTFDEHVKKQSSNRQLTQYIDPESLVTCRDNYETLGDSLQDYTTDGKFTDLKKAYTVNNILHPGQTIKRDEYTTLQQLKAARDAPLQLSKEEREFIDQKQKLELDFETNRITRMKDRDNKIDDYYTRLHGRAIELPTYKK